MSFLSESAAINLHTQQTGLDAGASAQTGGGGVNLSAAGLQDSATRISSRSSGSPIVIADLVRNAVIINTRALLLRCQPTV